MVASIGKIASPAQGLGTIKKHGYFANNNRGEHPEAKVTPSIRSASMTTQWVYVHQCSNSRAPKSQGVAGMRHIRRMTERQRRN